MKIFILLICTCFITKAFAVDWSQPPIACLDTLLPTGLTCLDLTQVKNPSTDFPETISDDEKSLWINERSADLSLCRSKEILRRNNQGLGNFTPWQVELAWMKVEAFNNKNLKLEMIYKAASENNMPANILFGALTQESLLANLAITPDGDNYSCGMAQINIQEFCRGISTLTLEERTNLGWPVIGCDEATLPTTVVKPLYLQATKNNPIPDYQLTIEDYKKIKYEDVRNSYSNEKTFLAASAFTKLCLDPKLSIKFKAIELKRLYNMIPAGLRAIEHYKAQETFNQNCSVPYRSNVYPLQTAWLLAVAMYNAGPNQIKLLQHYHQMTKETSADGSAWNDFTPQALVEGLHWGGKWKEGTTSIYFQDLDGKTYSQKWFKSCVVQRHVARVVQHVTKRGKIILNSIEQVPCQKDVVPDYRQHSSGIKEND
jgi:hypothetical protein